MSMAIIVTGASGFVGRALVQRLASSAPVVAMSRSAVSVPEGSAWRSLPDLAADGLDRATLPPAGCMVHLAAIAHAPHPASRRGREAIWRVNALAPVALARAAVRSGVRRFVFVSSVKALAESSTVPLVPDDEPLPVDAYGEAKLAAERSLAQLAAETGLELVIVRPPLVYGDGVRGNFLQLVNLVRSGMPLPFARIDNRRSLVGVENMADLLAVACEATAAAGGVFHVTDGASLSTRQLTEQIASAFNVRLRLLPVPQKLLSIGLRAAGRGRVADRLIGSLELDDSATRRRLNWRPPLTLAEGLAKMARSVQ